MPRETILLADDSQDIIDGMKLFLELKDFEVKTALNAVEVQSIIDAHKPALIILDIFLSGSDGREICRTIKNHPETNFIKVILSSAAPQALLDYHVFGADDILEKPFGLEEIYKKVGNVLKITPPL